MLKLALGCLSTGLKATGGAAQMFWHIYINIMYYSSSNYCHVKQSFQVYYYTSEPLRLRPSELIASESLQPGQLIAYESVLVRPVVVWNGSSMVGGDLCLV